MKYLLVLASIVPISLFAQVWTRSIPDYFDQPASTSHHYVKNEGQVINTDDAAETSIKAECRGGYADQYFFNDKIATVVPVYDKTMGDIDLVLLGRYDLSFTGGNYTAAEPVLHNATSAYYNFYIPGCGTGKEDVTIHERLVYEDAYPDIDINFFSSEFGPKMYMVVYPNGNPDNINFNVDGFDQLQVNANDLVGSFDNYTVTINKPVAYQFSTTNSIIPLTWQPTFAEELDGSITMSYGAYDNTKPLVLMFHNASYGYSEKTTHGLRNLEWATMFGNGEGTLEKTSTDKLIVSMRTNKNKFAKVVGKYVPTGTAQSTHVAVSQLKENGSLEWLSYFGSDRRNHFGEEVSSAVASNNHIFLASEAEVLNTGIPIKSKTGAYNESVNACTGSSGICIDIFIAEFDELGKLQWSTYYGEGSIVEFVNDVHIDKDDNLYLVCTMDGIPNLKVKTGATNNTTTAQSTTNNILVKFDANQDLEWATAFGRGNMNDITTDGSGHIYVCGETPYSIPLQNANQSTKNGGKEGFVAKFNGSTNLLEWSTYHGGNGDEFTEDILAFDNKVWIAGNTGSSTLFPTKQASGYAYYDGTYNGGSSTLNWNSSYGDAFLTGFSLTGSLYHSTYMGGANNERFTCLYTDNEDMYVGGFTSSDKASPFPHKSAAGSSFYYLDDTRNSSDWSDGYFASLTPTLNQKWTTYFGGEDNTDEVFDMERIGNTLFVSGETYNSAQYLDLVKKSAAYFENQQLRGGLLLAFNLDSTNTGIDDFGLQFQSSGINIYPNPARNYVSITSEAHIISARVLTSTGSSTNIIKQNVGFKGTLYLNGLSKGMYLLEFITDKGMSYERILVD